MPKLLIVDDVAADRVLASRLASKWLNCTVYEARDGKSAMEQISIHRPDIVLTDMHMPEMDGLELVSAVKDEHPNIPIILMTALGSEELASEALRRGAASYVPKLRLAADLVDTLTQVYDTWVVAHSLSRLMHYMRDSSISFDLPNDPSLLQNCVNQLLAMLRCLPLGDESERLRVGIALQEALNNACYHGNLELTPEEYQSDESSEVVAARMWTAPYAERRIAIEATVSRDQAEFVIRDEGAGFDTKLPIDSDEISSGEGKRGRGLRLMQSIMDSVHYNEAGNEVTMTRNAVRTENDDMAGDDGD